MITKEQLVKIMPLAKGRVDVFLQPLNDAMQEFNIDTKLRQAAFLAQIAHESGELRYVKEIASGSAYEGRKDLGNTMPGDGVRHKGRGLLQITGKANYTAAMLALGIDCLVNPSLLEQPENACRVSTWFWSTIDGNTLADAGDFLKISVRINGRNTQTGLPNGWEDRLKYYNVAMNVL